MHEQILTAVSAGVMLPASSSSSPLCCRNDTAQPHPPSLLVPSQPTPPALLQVLKSCPVSEVLNFASRAAARTSRALSQLARQCRLLEAWLTSHTPFSGYPCYVVIIVATANVVLFLLVAKHLYHQYTIRKRREKLFTPNFTALATVIHHAPTATTNGSSLTSAPALMFPALAKLGTVVERRKKFKKVRKTQEELLDLRLML